MEIVDLLEYGERAQLRAWFERHAATEKCCWIAMYRGKKKPEGVCLPYLDVVEEALCFGWIDSTLKRLPDGRLAQRLSPRQKRSHWTELNKQRCADLEARGLMTDHGRAALQDTNKYNMKRILLALLCAACMTSMEAKTLVAYFSATGTTKAAAARLAKQHDARLWEIEPAEPYSAADLDWRNDKSRSSIEMNDPEERPAIKQCTDVTPYDTVYVGFPIWWGICPRIINSWLDNNLPQLEGKTMIPFATSGSSGIGEAEVYLKKTYPTLKWQKGLLLNKR